MSPARRRTRAPQMISVSKQTSKSYPQTRSGAYVFTRYREKRRKRIVTMMILLALAVSGGAAAWLWLWPR